MKVADLKPDSKVDVIELTIVDKGEPREFTSRYGTSGRVCDATARDADGGEVSVTLWNDEIGRVNAEDRIRITNGWVRQYRGNLQVSAGRYGTLEIL